MFKQYYNPLCNFAATIVHDPKTAQDIVQDVFTKLWAKRDELSISTSEKSYLFQAVKNRSLEILRHKKQEEKYAESSMASAEVDRISVDEEADNYLLREFMYKSIRQLPPKCQEVFMMNKINGLTYREIAEDLDISVKTVENQIGKAYRILRELMAGRLSELN